MKKTPDDHTKKTYGKKGIKRQKIQNKLTTKTPPEPASSATVNKNVRPEDDKLWDENVAYFTLKPLQLPPDYDFHDHNICIAHQLGLNYDALIPTCFSKYFDNEAMVPVIPFRLKPYHAADSNSDTSDPFPWDQFENIFDEVSSLECDPCDNSPSPPSDGDVMGLESNDAPVDLGGPLTSSKTKKVMEQSEKDSKWAKSNELPKLIA